MSYIIFLRDKAIFSTENLSSLAIFIDILAQNGHLGIGIYNSNISCFFISSVTIATTITHNIFFVKLFAIDVAFAHLISLLTLNLLQLCGSVTLFTDNQAALNTLNNPNLYNSQFLITNISM